MPDFESGHLDYPQRVGNVPPAHVCLVQKRIISKNVIVAIKKNWTLSKSSPTTLPINSEGWAVLFFFESTWVLSSGLVTPSPHTLNWNTG
jgi:hypothetical protein